MGGRPRLTKEILIERCVAINGDQYSFEKTDYINNCTKVTLTCKDHGDFQITPGALFQGIGCYHCGRIKFCNKKTRTQEDFLALAREKHGDKYDYSKTKYVKSGEKVIITCSIHGDFEQVANSHVVSGMGCKLCGYAVMREKRTGEKSPCWRPDTAKNAVMTNKHRNLLNHSIKAMKKEKNSHASEMLGYTPKQLKAHLESFNTWTYEQEMHIDHIIPAHFFIKKGITDVSLINGLWNLQPLTPTENMQKGGKVCPLLEQQFEEIIESVKKNPSMTSPQT
jgi:hypothetical protein